jgi:hypothetical protein
MEAASSSMNWLSRVIVCDLKLVERIKMSVRLGNWLEAIDAPDSANILKSALRWTREDRTAHMFNKR